MAYVLGFFAADGTMRRTNRDTHFIEFHITDRELLERIKNTVGSNHCIATRDRADGWKLGYRLQIGSRQWFEDLSQLGFTPRKSNEMIFPRVPEQYLADFVRGYFDGDGNVYFKQHPRSDRDTLVWVFTSRFTSGSNGFLKALHEALKKHAGVAGGRIATKERGFELVFSRHDSLALYGFLYNTIPHGLLLERKYRTFRRAVGILFPTVEHTMRVRA
ncbi:hypothetical protein GVX82_02435 [Patescibacteria group bacterium]|nr:hypothetical protein [Patescibacteria group bacterium]